MSSKEEIERLVDAFIKDFPKAFSKLIGRRVGMKVTRLERREIVAKTEEIIAAFQKLQRIKARETDSSKLLSKFFEVLDELMHSVIPEIPRDQHFVNWFIEFYKNALKIPPALTYLKATNFKDYQNLLSALIWKMFSLGRKESVDKFLDQVSKSDDAYILGQAFFTRLRDYYIYLQKGKIRVTRATLEKCVRIYGELAGHFEKWHNPQL